MKKGEQYWLLWGFIVALFIKGFVNNHNACAEPTKLLNFVCKDRTLALSNEKNDNW